MWTALAQRLRPPPPAALADFDDEHEPPREDSDRGWYASSWALASGVEVTELPALDAAQWFAAAT